LDQLLLLSEQGPIQIDHEKFSRVHGSAFEDMLRFFYYNEETLDLLNVCRLVEFAKEMGLVKLMRLLERNIEASPITIESAPYLLEVAFTQLDENPDLKQKLNERALSFLVEHMDDIDFRSLDTMPPKIGATIIMGIQWVVQTCNVAKGADPSSYSISRSPFCKNENGALQSKDKKDKRKLTERKSAKV